MLNVKGNEIKTDYRKRNIINCKKPNHLDWAFTTNIFLGIENHHLIWG